MDKIAAIFSNIDASDPQAVRSALAAAANKLDSITKRLDDLRERLDDEMISPEACLAEARSTL